jgi:hypothetical protein
MMYFGLMAGIYAANGGNVMLTLKRLAVAMVGATLLNTAQATDTVTCGGILGVNLNGTAYPTTGPMPLGASFTYSATAPKFMISARATLPTRPARSSVSVRNQGFFAFVFNLRTTRSSPSSQRLQIRYTLTETAGCAGVSHGTTGKSQSNASVTMAKDSLSLSGVDQEIHTPVTKSKKKSTKVLPAGAAFYLNPDGSYSADFGFQTEDHTAWAKASYGTATNVDAIGSTSSTFSAMRVVWNPKTARGSTHAFLKSLEFEIETSTGTPVDEWSVDTDGGFADLALDEYSAGAYNLYVKTTGALRKLIPITYDGLNDVTGLDFSLHFGDLDGDNAVSSAEVSYVLSAVGASVADGDSWMEVPFGGTFAPYMADLDRDGAVTTADYSLALASLGLTGD